MNGSSPFWDTAICRIGNLSFILENNIRLSRFMYAYIAPARSSISAGTFSWFCCSHHRSIFVDAQTHCCCCFPGSVFCAVEEDWPFSSFEILYKLLPYVFDHSVGESGSRSPPAPLRCMESFVSMLFPPLLLFSLSSSIPSSSLYPTAARDRKRSKAYIGGRGRPLCSTWCVCV